MRPRYAEDGHHLITRALLDRRAVRVERASNPAQRTESSRRSASGSSASEVTRSAKRTVTVFRRSSGVASSSFSVRDPARRALDPGGESPARAPARPLRARCPARRGAYDGSADMPRAPRPDVRPVEREHQLAAKSFAERVLGDQRLELGDEICARPLCQLAVDEVFESGERVAPRAGDLRRPRTPRTGPRERARATARVPPAASLHVQGPSPVGPRP